MANPEILETAHAAMAAGSFARRYVEAISRPALFEGEVQLFAGNIVLASAIYAERERTPITEPLAQVIGDLVQNAGPEPVGKDLIEPLQQRRHIRRSLSLLHIRPEHEVPGVVRDSNGRAVDLDQKRFIDETVGVHEPKPRARDRHHQRSGTAARPRQTSRTKTAASRIKKTARS